MEKISVVLTTYNSEKVLQRAIDSVLKQEGVNEKFTIELIVVDDCSKDRTVEILKENKIEFLTTSENSGGPNKGRNMGLRKATGDFICIMDHDDEWFSDKIISQLSVAHLAPIITSGLTMVDHVQNKKTDRSGFSTDGSGFIFYKENESFITILSKSKTGQKAYLGSIMFHQSSKSFFEENFGMIDFDWGLRLFEGRSSVELCKPTYFRHYQGSNLSQDENYRRKDFYFGLLSIEPYRNKFKREVILASQRIHGSRARYYYYIGDMKSARIFFRRSSFSLKTVLYYLTTFYGHKYVNRKYKVFI